MDDILDILMGVDKKNEGRRMKKFQAPHEKLTEEEIKEQVESLLSSILKFKDKWKSYDWEIDEFIEKQEAMIFKLRRHFFPEKTTIMQVSIAELSDMMRYPDEPPV